MAISVSRTKHSLGRHAGRATLEQSFRFDGPGVGAAAIRDILLQAPLIGSNSVFGDRPGNEKPATASQRTVRGFSPAPGFLFDVEMTERAQGVVVVTFSQPGRTVQYLEGDLLWTVSDAEDGAVFHEQINTGAALDEGLQPLGGAKPSVRRWLFFRVGHKQVMLGAAKNIASLVANRKV